jgi:hypothetical protein
LKGFEMARNRRNQSASIRFGPALKALMLCLLIGGSGIGYVWQKSQINGLSKEISAREKRLAALEDANERLRKQLAFMRSPAFLEGRIKEMNLGLAAPQPGQVWRLEEPVLESAIRMGERDYASRRKETGTALP